MAKKVSKHAGRGTAAVRLLTSAGERTPFEGMRLCRVVEEEMDDDDALIEELLAILTPASRLVEVLFVSELLVDCAVLEPLPLGHAA